MDFQAREGRRYLNGSLDKQLLFDAEDTTDPDGGGIALICEEGRMACETVTVQPVAS